MKKKLTFFLFVFLFLVYNSYSQNNVKMNFGAALAADNSSIGENNIPLLIQGIIPEMQRTIERIGGTFKYSSDDIALVVVKAKNIESPLYLQKAPTSDSLTVKEAITNCARPDVFTGTNLPTIIGDMARQMHLLLLPDMLHQIILIKMLT